MFLVFVLETLYFAGFWCKRSSIICRCAANATLDFEGREKISRYFCFAGFFSEDFREESSAIFLDIDLSFD